MNDLPNSPESRDIATVLHAYTNLKKHQETGPMVIRKGKGIWVYDESGKAYIEGLAGLWCTSLGFGENRLIEAAKAPRFIEVHRDLRATPPLSK